MPAAGPSDTTSRLARPRLNVRAHTYAGPVTMARKRGGCAVYHMRYFASIGILPAGGRVLVKQHRVSG